MNTTNTVRQDATISCQIVLRDSYALRSPTQLLGSRALMHVHCTSGPCCNMLPVPVKLLSCPLTSAPSARATAAVCRSMRCWGSIAAASAVGMRCTGPQSGCRWTWCPAAGLAHRLPPCPSDQEGSRAADRLSCLHSARSPPDLRGAARGCGMSDAGSNVMRHYTASVAWLVGDA